MHVLSSPFATKTQRPQQQTQDSKLKTWAWERALLCAYKDDQLQPVPVTKVVTRISWADAPPCAAAPNATVAAPDRAGRLWGWERDR